MVTLPPSFVATKYPGYFWNLDNRKLYSIKVGGILRELYRGRPSHFNHYLDGYQVSVNGRKRCLEIGYLMKLKAEDSVIPVQEKA